MDDQRLPNDMRALAREMEQAGSQYAKTVADMARRAMVIERQRTLALSALANTGGLFAVLVNMYDKVTDAERANVSSGDEAMLAMKVPIDALWPFINGSAGDSVEVLLKSMSSAAIDTFTELTKASLTITPINPNPKEVN